MEAIVKISGKQYRVSEGQRLTVDRLATPVGDEVTFEQVLLLTDGAKATVGTPLIDGAAVRARVVGAPRGRKIVVYKYKPKKRYRRTQGHRAALSVLEVLAVSASSAGPKAAGKAEKAPQTKAAAKAKAGGDEAAAKAKAGGDKDKG